MPNKPVKPVDRPVISKRAGRRPLGVDAPRTKPLRRQILFLLLCVCAGAACLEIAAGVDASREVKRDVLFPIWGKAY